MPEPADEANDGHPGSQHLNLEFDNSNHEAIDELMQDHRRQQPLPLSDRARRLSESSNISGTSQASPSRVQVTHGNSFSANNRPRKQSAAPSRRPRGFSRSSTRSDAISVYSRKSSRSMPLAATRSRTRSQGNADDSDAESNDSYGQTDEDVCFPMDQLSTIHPDHGVNVSELDQLLNLSSDSESLTAGVQELPAPMISFETKEPERRDGDSHPTNSMPEDKSKQKIQPDTPNSSSTQAETNKSPRLFRSPKSPLLPPIRDALRVLQMQRDKDSSSSGEMGSDNTEVEKKFDGIFASSPGPNEVNERPNLMSSRRMSRASRQMGSTIREESDVISTVESQRFSFFAAEMDETIHASELASLVGDNESFGSLFNRDKGVWWLDCYLPTDVEMKAMSRAFGIHPLTTEDIKTEESREKFEMFSKYYFVVYNSFENDPNDERYMEPINFYMVVFADGVISFHFSPVSHCRSVRRRMRQLRDYVKVSPDWICYALVDDITDSFAPVIQKIENEADYIEDAVYVQGGAAEIGPLLSRLGEARKSTMTMIRLLTGKADVIKGFAKRCNEEHNMPGSDMALYLGDIQDHIVTMQQNLTAYEKIFSRSHYNYMGILQMEFVNSSNRMTTVLSNVTVIGTILVPMNLVTGMFGMNVRVPGEGGSNLGWWFGILGVMILSIVVLSTIATILLRRLRSNDRVMGVPDV